VLAAAAPASACRGPQSQTLLETLPASALEEQIVAKVEVIEALKPRWVTKWTYTPRVRVRVIEALKGVQVGQLVTLDSLGTTCDQMFSRQAIGMQGYIAGRIEQDQDGETVFAGQWQTDRLTGGLRQVR
jgi:hypothetical protein